MYYATQILGGGELGPVNKEEMMYLILTLTVSAILNALIFGDIAGLVQSLSAKDSQYQDKIDLSNGVMDALEMEEELQVRVREFIQITGPT